MKTTAYPVAFSQLLQDLADFLDSTSIAQAQIAFCEHCGSKMQPREFDFWLLGTEKVWTIPFPICPKCARATVRESRTIH
jgi:hypothetical protein